MTALLFDRPGLFDPAVTDAEFAEIVDELTRRGFLAGGLGSAVAFGLAACGSPDDDSATSPAATQWSFTDDLGHVTRLPTRPQRVIALAESLTTTLYSAGLTVVGGAMTTSTGGDLQYLGMPQSAIEAIVQVNSENDLKLETLAAAKPDLLIDAVQNGRSGSLDKYPTLTKFAPVVAVDLQTATLDAAMGTVHRLVTSLGVTTLTDKKDQDRYEDLAGQLTSALAAKPGLRVAFCWSGPDGINVSTESQWSYMRTLAALGMRYTPVHVGAADYWQTFSWEQAADIQADLLVLWNGGVPTNPAWRTMPAVRAKQFVDLSDKWFLTSYGRYADNLAALLDVVRSAEVVA